MVSSFRTLSSKVANKIRNHPLWSVLLFIYFIAYAAAVFHFYRYLGNDDVFITLRYAYNIAHGEGFVFNPGEYVLGTTTPLLTIILGFLGLFFGSLEVILVRVLQLCLVLLAILTLRIGWKAAGYRGVLGALFVPWLLLADRVLIHQFGMETPLFLLLMAGLFLAHMEGREILSGILLALLTLTRPEGVLAAPVLFVDYFFRKKRIPWKGIISFSILYGVWALYALWRFGSVLPHSVAVKAIQGTSKGHFHFVSKIWTTYRGWYLAPWLFTGFFGLLLSLIRRVRILILFAGWCALCLTGYTIAAAPDYPWYYLPIFWILYLFAGFAISEAWLAVTKLLGLFLKKYPRLPQKIAASLLCLFLIFIAFHSVTTIRKEFLVDWYISDSYETGSIINKGLLPYKHFGKWINRNASRKAEVTCIEIGIVGFYGKRKVIDLAGLINPSITRYLEKEDYDWWIKPYELPKFLIVHIPVWKAEGIQQDFLRYFYKPIMFETDKGLFVLKSRPDEYNFAAEREALKKAVAKALGKPNRRTLDQWIAYASYLGNEASLLKACELAYEKYPHDRYYKLGLARSLIKTRPPQPERAAELYHQLVKEYPKDYYYLKNWIEIMISLDKGSECIDVVKNYTKRNPDDPWGFRFLTRLHRVDGKPSESVKAAEKLIELEPEVFWHYRSLALAHEVNGEYSKAIKNWEIFLELAEGEIQTPDLTDRLRALEALAAKRPIPADVKKSDYPTTPRLSGNKARK